MSGVTKDEARRLLPRWRESAIAAASPEVRPLPATGGSMVAADRSSLDERLEEWRNEPNVGTAAEAVAHAFVFQAFEKGRGPAEFLVAHAQSAGPIVVDLARRVLGLPRDDGAPTGRTINHKTAVAALRARLIRSPNDPLSYVDLARRYAALGQHDKAKKAMRAALALAPVSRFVLRSASRLYVHTKDFERAHDVLRRSPRTRRDPWLMAAEISAATVAGRSSNLVKLARDIVTQGSVAAIHVSELAGALATLELNAGNARGARRLFSRALHDPTDNSLAQAQWASAHLELEHIPTAEAVPMSFEAAALDAARNGEWARGLEACYEWLDDEPFSHKSAMLGSFIAAVGVGDYSEAVLLADEGLTANPNEQTLRNNLVYALLNDGRVERAASEARSADVTQMDDETRIAWSATYGLLFYRLGDRARGREFYQAAIAAAESRGKSGMAAVAALNWALVTTQIKDDDAITARSTAMGLSERVAGPHVSALRARLVAAMADEGGSGGS